MSPYTQAGNAKANHCMGIVYVSSLFGCHWMLLSYHITIILQLQYHYLTMDIPPVALCLFLLSVNTSFGFRLVSEHDTYIV